MRTLVVLLLTGGALAASGAGYALGSSGHTTGKALYRTFCGQCHALAAADATGGSSDHLKATSGPSFTNLRVPNTLVIVALTALRGPRGHAIALKQMTWQQLRDTADFVSAVTAANPRLARLSAS